MSGDLFRREVFEAKRTSWLGGISLAQPPSMWLLAGCAVVAAMLIVTFLTLGEYTRRSTVTGQLVPDLGLSTVVAPTAGVVGRLFPEEGERVEAGDSLTLIQVPRSIASGGDALAAIRKGLDDRRDSLESLEQSQLVQVEAQQTGYMRQLAGARQELVQIEREIATRREQVRIGNETIQRYQSVANEKYVSQVQVNQQQQSVLEMVNAQQALERQATTIRRNIAQLEQSVRELAAQRGILQSASRRDLALLEQERVQQEASGELLIKAPVAGLVASRLIESGQAVQAGQPLMALLPKGSHLQAQLLVPSRAVGFIEPGDRVLLRYQAFPYQKFGHHGGQVIRVSRSAINPEAVGGRTNEPYYRVLVALDQQAIMAYGKPEPLRPGMVLDADVLGDTRKLYEWVIEPLYSLRGKVSS
jgi:membrane fusion protein